MSRWHVFNISFKTSSISVTPFPFVLVYPGFRPLTFHTVSCNTDAMISSSDSSLCPPICPACQSSFRTTSVSLLGSKSLCGSFIPFFLGIYHPVLFLAFPDPLPSPSSQWFMKMLYSFLCFCPHSWCFFPLAWHPFINLSHSIQRLTDVPSSTWNLPSSPPTLTGLPL